MHMYEIIVFAITWFTFVVAHLTDHFSSCAHYWRIIMLFKSQPGSFNVVSSLHTHLLRLNTSILKREWKCWVWKQMKPFAFLVNIFEVAAVEGLTVESERGQNKQREESSADMRLISQLLCDKKGKLCLSCPPCSISLLFNLSLSSTHPPVLFTADSRYIKASLLWIDPIRVSLSVCSFSSASR